MYDEEETVIIDHLNVVGFIIKHYIGGYDVRYALDGIEYEEFLTDEDVTIIEGYEAE